MARDYLDLYQDGAAAGATTVGNSGLGATAAERATMPSYRARKKKRKNVSGTAQHPSGTLGLDALSNPAGMNKAPSP